MVGDVDCDIVAVAERVTVDAAEDDCVIVVEVLWLIEFEAVADTPDTEALSVADSEDDCDCDLKAVGECVVVDV